jgi:ribosomal protein S6
VWGRRKLAYPIDKKEDGIYHLLSFASSPETLDELSRVLKIDDDVMRHMATRRPEGGPSEPIAAGAAIGDDAETAPADTLEEE